MGITFVIKATYRWRAKIIKRIINPSLAWAIYFYFAVMLVGPPASGLDYPWGILVPENDSRDQEMRRYDEADTVNMISVINESEKAFHHHIIGMKISTKDLLSARTAFCEMHFDAVRPLMLTPNEKGNLQEYLKRGGFILFVIDTYPYAQSDFWSVKQWPLIDFIRQELPAADSNFSAARATDDFPVFEIHYKTQTADAIRHELLGNPNTPNRTLLFYKGRLCCFVMGKYGYLEGDAWVPIPRPFPFDFSMDPKSYRLIVNIFYYSIIQ